MAKFAKNMISILSFIKRHWKLFSVVLVVFAMGMSATFYRPPYSLLLAVFQKIDENPKIQNFAFNILQARASFQKSYNIIHFPFWFRGTQLPVYNLYIDLQDIQLMNAKLPKNIYSDNLGQGSRLFVDAIFKSDGYEEEVETRYRGALNSHWLHAKDHFS